MSALHAVRTAVRTTTDRLGLAPVIDQIIASARDRRLPSEERGWHATLDPLLRNGLTSVRDARWNDPRTPGVPVVVCLWNRPERARTIVAMLESLAVPDGVKLLFWNNQPDHAERYRWVADHEPTGALRSLDLVDSPVNIGGLARFVAARWLRNTGYSGPLVMLDDDQDVRPTFVTDLAADWSPRSLVGWWAFNQVRSYWDREQVPAGSLTDHVGTGGAMIDPSLVDDDRFFFTLPRRFAFLEDQWMSYQARARGWRLQKAHTEIDFVMEERNQYHGMIELKDEFYRYLEATPAFLPPRPNLRAGRRGTLRPA